MPLKSPYPDVPAYPDLNAHHIFFNRPDQAQWPADFTLHIDARTGKRRSYREFVARVQLGANALGASVSEGGLELIGGEGGEMVGIISQNSMDYITLIHSLIFITTPFALISAYSTPFELKHALTLTKPTRLFVNAHLLSLVLPVVKKIGMPLNRIYILGGHAKGRKSLAGMIEHARSHKIPNISPQAAVRDTLAYLVFSSGTGGLPKAVMISHGNIIFTLMQATVVGLEVAKVYTPPEPNTPDGIPAHLAVLPLHHTYGLHFYSFRSFLSPSTWVILDKWNLDIALKAFSKYQITFAALVPSLVYQIVNYPGIEKVDLSSVQGMGSGAAYLPTELSAKMKALLPKNAFFAEGYGMSETTISAIGQPFPGTFDGRVKAMRGSTGFLSPGMEARLVREDGSDADVGEVGELYLKGKNIALGYWRDEKATQASFGGGWLRTGDRFRVTEDGYFFFADRAKDTLKISGIQVSPVEIENVLLAEPQKLITDVTVAGVSGGRTSDEKVPRAWVVLSVAGKKLGAAATVKQLENWHKEHLSKYKWLRGGIEVVKQIPKSPTGKVLRRVLQDKYEQRVAKRIKGKL